MKSRRGKAAALLVAVLSFVCADGARARHERTWPAEMRAEPPQNVVDLVRAQQGHVVLFVLYAAWCSDCRAELPVLDELEERYRARGLSVVAVSIDDPEDLTSMLRARPLRSAPLVRVSPVDPSAISASMRAMGATWTCPIPYLALFDGSGGLLREWPAGDAKERQLKASVERAL